MQKSIRNYIGVIKYLPVVILIAVALFVGRWTAPDHSKELEKKFEAERKVYQDRISDLKVALINKDKAGQAIREKMYSDSVKTVSALRANKEAYNRLKNKYNEINLSRANSHDLDSIISVLFPD